MLWKAYFCQGEISKAAEEGPEDYRKEDKEGKVDHQVEPLQFNLKYELLIVKIQKEVFRNNLHQL